MPPARREVVSRGKEDAHAPFFGVAQAAPARDKIGIGVTDYKFAVAVQSVPAPGQAPRIL